MNLDKLILDELFAQMLQKNEIQHYQEDKEILFDKKVNDRKNKKSKREFHLCSEYNKKVRHKLKNC